MRIFVNNSPLEVGEGLTIAALLADLDLDPRQLAVERNLELVPRGQHAEVTLVEGDRLEVVTLVGGG
jgi:sulfur carrier protein